uniref:Uncharacterized protein n=1 Tax=Mus musculus TaxID=10090 RepID=Q3U2T7_MOUSE|nr:unnamed protein product [Mus musculus]
MNGTPSAILWQFLLSCSFSPLVTVFAHWNYLVSYSLLAFSSSCGLMVLSDLKELRQWIHLRYVV